MPKNIQAVMTEHPELKSVSDVMESVYAGEVADE